MNQIVLRIQSKSARELPKRASRFPDEKEVIFLPNTKFRVKSSETGPHGEVYIDLAEI